MGSLFGGGHKFVQPPPPPAPPPAAIPPTLANASVQQAGANQRARAAAGAGPGGFNSTLIGSPEGSVLTAPNTARASLLGAAQPTGAQ